VTLSEFIEKLQDLQEVLDDDVDPTVSGVYQRQWPLKVHPVGYMYDPEVNAVFLVMQAGGDYAFDVVRMVEDDQERCHTITNLWEGWTA